MSGKDIAFLSFTERGRALASELRSALGGTTDCTRDDVYTLRTWTAEMFPQKRALVYVGAAGIAVRAIAPYLAGKASDPAIVAVDERGRFAVPLASGHLGGANALAREIARVCGATPVVTTATDVNGVFAVDEWARVQGMAVADPKAIKAVSAKALEGETIFVNSTFPIAGEPPENVCLTGREAPDVWVDARPHPGLCLVPKALVLGAGCRRGTTEEALEARFASLCAEHGIQPRAVCAAATIDRKADEPGLRAFCRAHGWELLTYSAEELNEVGGGFTASAFVAAQVGVDNVCERAAVKAAGGALLVKKYAGEGITLALARKPLRFDWRWRNG